MSWEPWWGTGSTHRIAVPLENLAPIFDFRFQSQSQFQIKEFRDFVISFFLPPSHTNIETQTGVLSGIHHEKVLTMLCMLRPKCLLPPPKRYRKDTQIPLALKPPPMYTRFGKDESKTTYRRMIDANKMRPMGPNTISNSIRTQ